MKTRKQTLESRQIETLSRMLIKRHQASLKRKARAPVAKTQEARVAPPPAPRLKWSPEHERMYGEAVKRFPTYSREEYERKVLANQELVTKWTNGVKKKD